MGLLPRDRGPAALVLAMFVVVLSLLGCDRARNDSAESLARDPKRLVEVSRECESDSVLRAKLCEEAAEAWRRRLFHGGHQPGSLPPAPQSTEAPASSDTEPTPWLAGS